jgi:antitoxin (DNA-binding transcriptional repressor) of toxin-antitoxin stability system
MAWRGELIVTDHGKPVLKILPSKPKAGDSEKIGEFRGQATCLEDINSPTLIKWEGAPNQN